MTNGLAVTKQAPPGIDGSIQTFPKVEEAPRSNSWVLSLASVADTFTPWGRSVRRRDAELRAFWPTEPVLASAIYRVCIRNANATFKLDGPPRTVKAVQDMLDDSGFGKGIKKVFVKASVDYYTQDNSAFLELAGRRRETDPVLAVNHLDSAQCRRTGNPEYPVVWWNPRTGAEHRLAWFQVVTLEEFPSPVTTMNDVQYSALTRILRAAQIMRDIGVMDAEKASGRFMKRLHLVGGVSTQVIEDKLLLSAERADNQGLARYVDAAVLGSLDPTATVSHEVVDFAGLPQDFDYETWMKWYINNIALGLGEDYQTFAPLPGGNLGTSAQSVMLDLKSKGGGAKTWTGDIAAAFRAQSIIPQSVSLTFEERDLKEELDRATVEQARATTRATRITSGEITVQVARNIAQDDGDLSVDYLTMLEQADANPDITVSDDEDAETVIDDIDEAETQNRRLPAPVKPVAVAPAAAQPVTGKDLAIREALDELRDSREALVALKGNEGEGEMKPAEVMQLVTEAMMKGIQIGAGAGGNGGSGTHIHLDKMLVDGSEGMTKALMERPAPVVNVAPAAMPEIVVNVPAQKEMDWQPLADAFNRLSNAVLARPAPQVTVDAPISINLPKVSSEETKVHRDGEGNMTGTTKTVEYAP